MPAGCGAGRRASSSSASKPTSIIDRISSTKVSAARATSPRIRPTSTRRRRVAHRPVRLAGRSCVEPAALSPSPPLSRRAGPRPASRLRSPAAGRRRAAPSARTARAFAARAGRSSSAVTPVPGQRAEHAVASAADPSTAAAASMPEIAAASMQPALRPQSVQSPASTRLLDAGTVDAQPVRGRSRATPARTGRTGRCRRRVNTLRTSGPSTVDRRGGRPERRRPLAHEAADRRLVRRATAARRVALSRDARCTAYASGDAARPSVGVPRPARAGDSSTRTCRTAARARRGSRRGGGQPSSASVGASQTCAACVPTVPTCRIMSRHRGSCRTSWRRDPRQRAERDREHRDVEVVAPAQVDRRAPGSAHGRSSVGAAAAHARSRGRRREARQTVAAGRVARTPSATSAGAWRVMRIASRARADSRRARARRPGGSTAP